MANGDTYSPDGSVTYADRKLSSKSQSTEADITLQLLHPIFLLVFLRAIIHMVCSPIDWEYALLYSLILRRLRWSCGYKRWV